MIAASGPRAGKGQEKSRRRKGKREEDSKHVREENCTESEQEMQNSSGLINYSGDNFLDNIPDCSTIVVYHTCVI